MSEDLGDHLSVFEGTGLSRGTMNGKPLGVVADPDGGYRCSVGQDQFLKELRAYEKRKGISRTYRDSIKRKMRSEIAERMAIKRGRAHEG